jgi:hypothetical protein
MRHSSQASLSSSCLGTASVLTMQCLSASYWTQSGCSAPAVRANPATLPPEDQSLGEKHQLSTFDIRSVRATPLPSVAQTNTPRLNTVSRPLQLWRGRPGAAGVVVLPQMLAGTSQQGSQPVLPVPPVLSKVEGSRVEGSGAAMATARRFLVKRRGRRGYCTQKKGEEPHDSSPNRARSTRRIPLSAPVLQPVGLQ